MGPAELTANYVDAFNRRDAETMWSMLGDDVTYVVGGAGPFTGPEAVKSFYAPLLDSDLSAQTISSVEQGDTAFIENRLSGSLPNGVGFYFEQVVRQRWVNGLLKEYRNYNDQPFVDGERVSFEEFLDLMAEPSE